MNLIYRVHFKQETDKCLSCGGRREELVTLGGGREGGWEGEEWREGEREEGRGEENEKVRERKRVKVSCVTIDICREFSKFFFTPLVEILRG